MNSTVSWTSIPGTTARTEIDNSSVALNMSITNYGGNGNDALTVVLIPVVAVLCLILAIVIVAWALRRNRMDKLRQHLMPMYSLETSDSCQEWEVDLLSQEVRYGADSVTTMSSPCLKFSTMHSEL